MSGLPPGRWQAVRALFEDVIDLAPPERQRLLAARCADDAGLRHEVERLLQADSDAAFVVTPQRVAAGLASADPLGAAAQGAQIGEFTVRRLIGSGGMGAVYEAEQSTPKRLVAVKVLRPELCTGKTLRRFQVEAEILGRLQHPGIAEVFAAGLHRADAGPFRWDMPYYAMELLVDAKPITVHAREHGLSLEARLDMVASVCAAVHHAHLRGVIHRDLKPGNILVDATGEPKVIDFGVARATDHDPVLTATGAVVGTPNYMAPEQLRGDDVDVRTDVWALGVLLYELICERLPFALDGRSPTTQAQALATQPRAPHSVHAQASPELDWIVFKALAVERDRRYQTAADLAEDLARLRRHESVHAAPPSRTYRLRKAMRRHRTLTVGAAVGLFCLVLGAVATGIAVRRAWRAEADAAQEATTALAAARRERVARADADKSRGDAEAQAAALGIANRQVTSLLDIIQSAVIAASRRGKGHDVTLAQLWEQIATRVEGDTAVPAMTRAATFNYLAAIRFHSGDYAEAEALYRRSLAALADGDGLGTREEMTGRGSLSEALRLQGKYTESESELVAALDLAERSLSPDDPEALSLRRRWAFVQLNRGAWRDAVATCRAILAARLTSPGPDSPPAAEAHADLATALLVGGDAKNAEEEGRSAYAACARAFGAGAAKTGNIANTLVLALLRLERADEAEVIANEAAAAVSEALGANHPTAATLRRARARALHQRGDLPAAIAEYRDCLADLRATPTLEPRALLSTAAGLSEALLTTGDAEAAAAAAAPYVHDQPTAPAAVHVELCAAQRAHARALLALGKVAEALAILDPAVRAANARLGAEHAGAKQLATLRDEILKGAHTR